MPDYDFGVKEIEKKQLTDSINKIQVFLDQLIIERILVDNSIMDDIIDAWHDMPSNFHEIRNNLAMKDQLALILQGLSGGQLKLKLAITDSLMFAYNDSLSENGFDKQTKYRLRQLLSAHEILVSDLIQATNSSHALSSFIKCLISVLDDKSSFYSI